MRVREPVVAGQFYPGQRQACISEIERCLSERTIEQELPDEIVAGIVPHAGWTFSGAIAGLVFSAVKKRHEDVDTFVIFGAAHRYYGQKPVLCDVGVWMSPLGEVAIDEEFAGEIAATDYVDTDCDSHNYEHSIEVQVPFIQHLFPGAKIVPILTPPVKENVALGETTGSIIGRYKDKKVVCIGSTDLTHYGPSYSFVPMGAGDKGVKWASDVNDRRFIELAIELDAEGLFASVAENCNACGPGASAATVAAARKLGAKRGILAGYTNSNEVMKRKMGTRSSDSVGYAAIVF